MKVLYFILIVRWWRISLRRSTVVYPGEWAVNRDEVPDHERLLAEIQVINIRMSRSKRSVYYI